MRRVWPLAGAAIWSAGLLVAAFVVPAYRSSTAFTSSSSPSSVIVENSSGTLVQVNGPGVLVPLALPLLAVVAVALLLPAHRRPAWAVTMVVVGLSLLGMLTIGVFVLPVAMLLVVACAQPDAFA